MQLHIGGEQDKVYYKLTESLWGSVQVCQLAVMILIRRFEQLHIARKCVLESIDLHLEVHISFRLRKIQELSCATLGIDHGHPLSPC